MPLNADNPMRDALEIIRGTDVISAEKKRSLLRGLKGLRHRHCPASRNCAECLTQQRCVTAIADLLGS